jgi:hypothetical protein
MGYSVIIQYLHKVCNIAQPGQKLVRLYLKNKLDVVEHNFNPSYFEDRGRRTTQAKALDPKK